MTEYKHSLGMLTLVVGAPRTNAPSSVVPWIN